MAELIDYVRTLSDEIGPRPATTDGEHRAAEWLERVFASRGLETELQHFEAVRTYSWAYVIYHVLTMASAVVAGPLVLQGRLVWPAFAVSAIVAFFLWMDLDTRWGLTHLMPKGPSQNVIARHVPRARRGEKLRKIVVVAHYDSARASLAFSPGMVKNFPLTFGLLKACTFITPVLVLAMAMPFSAKLDPWLWYLTMAASAYLLVPTVINIHREIAMPYVAGANDNASGVAAMIGVMERLVPAPDADSLATSSFPAVRRGPDAALSAGVVDPGTALDYTPSGQSEPPLEIPDDFSWAETVPEPEREPGRGQAVLDFGTIEFGAVGDGWVDGASTAAADGFAGEEPAVDVLPAGVAESAPLAEEDTPSRRRLLGGLGRKRSTRDEPAPREWLGVDDGFDARKAGKDIGSWDKFDEEGDDGFGWKGGWAGDDPIGDPEYAASEAARIRRRVTESIDRELTEKEVWFVATGAEEVGTIGMQAFLHDFGPDLRDALIINIDGCGAGSLCWASAEGMARRYRASARLVGLARRVSRETETLIKPRVFKGLSTDATPALARGFKAMSIMALDADGVPVNWHWKTDTTDELDASLIEKTAEFVTAMVRDA